MIRRLANWLSDERGAIAPILVLLLIPIIGMMALGGEVASWHMKQRELQNIANSAALAAAANGGTGYAAEAAGVVLQYGGVNQGTGDFTLASTNTATCPTTGTATCYQVTVTQKVPLYLTQMVGYRGNGVNTQNHIATRLAAVAIASSVDVANYCLIALGAQGPGGKNDPPVKLTGSSADFSTCDARSNGTLQCSSSIQFAYLFSPDTTACNNTLGWTAASGYGGFFKDRNFSSLIAPSISGGCTPTNLALTDLPTSIYICSGNSKLAATLNITKPNTKIFVYDTSIDLNGNTFQTTGTGSATVVFTGASTTNTSTWIIDSSKAGNGVFTVKGANAGDFADMAIIADPKQTTTAAFAPAPKLGMTLNLLGGLYAPKTDITFPPNTYTTIGGLTCIAIEANTVSANGGKLGNIPADCKSAGYTGLPTFVLHRQTLVG